MLSFTHRLAPFSPTSTKIAQLNYTIYLFIFQGYSSRTSTPLPPDLQPVLGNSDLEYRSNGTSENWEPGEVGWN